MTASTSSAARPAGLRFVAGILSGLLLASACGGTGGNEGPPAASSAAAGGPQAFDPCTLVTAAEAQGALGAPVDAAQRPSEANIPPRLLTCRYVTKGEAAVSVLTVMVRQSGSPAEARIGFDGAREIAGAETVDDLGEAAFGRADGLHALRGSRYVIVGGDVDREGARRLMRAALERLP